MDRVSSRLFQAKQYPEALRHKVENNAIMVRWPNPHPTLGVVYEVIYLPMNNEDADRLLPRGNDANMT